MFSVPHQLRRLARVQCGMLTGKELNLDAKELEQTLQLSFYVKEIGVSATVCPILWQLPTCDHPREHGLLINPVAVFHEAEPGFEQANSRLLTVLIVSHGFQQSAPETRAHDRQIRRNRVCQRNAFPLWINQALNLRVYKAVGNRFLVSTRHEIALDSRYRADGLFLGAKAE